MWLSGHSRLNVSEFSEFEVEVKIEEAGCEDNETDTGLERCRVLWKKVFRFSIL